MFTMRPVRQPFQSLVLLFALFACAVGAAPESQPIPVPSPPALGAQSYLLMDFHSGRVLAERQADERRDPASLTKMMTAYVVFSELKAGKLSLEDSVLVSEKAWRAPGSRMFIEVGDRVPLEDLLRGMIVQSGNDASIALAEHVAGTEETFAQVMNQYAEALGLGNTHYQNANGLPEPEHYSSARDTARLVRALIRDFPDYYEYYSERHFTWNGIEQLNRNKLLWRDSSVDGLKTGHTEAAGYCLASSAERDGMRLVSVVMGADSVEARADDSLALLSYGFRFFETHRLYAASEALTRARVWKGGQELVSLGLARDLFVTIPRDRYDDLEATMSVEQTIMAPVQPAGRYGEVVVRLEGATVRTEPLVALEGVETGGLWRRMVDEVLLLFQ